MHSIFDSLLEANGIYVMVVCMYVTPAFKHGNPKSSCGLTSYLQYVYLPY